MLSQEIKITVANGAVQTVQALEQKEWPVNWTTHVIVVDYDAEDSPETEDYYFNAQGEEIEGDFRAFVR